MRSQASKSLPKKGVVKASLKTKPPVKKVISTKKKKLVSKSLVKGAKKNAPKEDAKSKSDGDTPGDKKDLLEHVKAGPAKLNSPSNDSPPKKGKKDPKEKKETVKHVTEGNIKKVIPKKPPKKVKNKKTPVKRGGKTIETKNKVTNVIKKTKPKYSKAKTVVKKGKTGIVHQKKKCTQQSKSDSTSEDKVDFNDTSSRETNYDDDSTHSKNDEEKDTLPRTFAEKTDKNIENEEKLESQLAASSASSSASSLTSSNSTGVTPVKVAPTKKPETPKTEMERPPKFFTSSRSPRMVDIDVKCFKNSKGNLSVSERFLSMKCETKSGDHKKDKSLHNTLISQGPEIDVYTFTEKIDSPKSILSDFRSSVSKNVGRVRPVARVKGTVVDKSTESEKKKYSPHRPIEEVVQQLIASKRTEEVNSNLSSVDLNSRTSDTKESDDAPKAIVSKSYKMVARKSSVTGKPFSPIQFPDQEPLSSGIDNPNCAKPSSSTKKTPVQLKKEPKSSSDEEFDSSKFALSTKAFQYSSSDESATDSNDESKDSSASNSSKNKKSKNKRYRKIMDGAKKTTSKELKELSKDSLVDLKEEDILLLGSEKPSKRRRKLLSMWNGPKKHRMASLNALAKVHCLYENESRTHLELGLMRTVERAPIPSTSKQPAVSKKKEVKPKEPEKHETTSESEYESKQEKKDDSSDSSDDSPPQRTLRGVPGIRSAGKYWDPKSCTSSSEESELESIKKPMPEKKKMVKASASSGKSDSDKPPAKMKKTAGVPVKKRRNRTEVVMDLKDMVVQKRMASLNATAILAASYEKRSPKSNKDETTSDSCSDDSFSQKPKNGVSSGIKSETKIEEPKKEKDIEDEADVKQKVEVIVNQDTDVTITGVYATHHHEGFCTVSGMQYRISSTSHTQTTATANCEKEGCPREDGARYTPLSALSSMQPPADHGHSHPHPVQELGGLSRRAGCSSAFSAPSPSAHHDPDLQLPTEPLDLYCDSPEVTITHYGEVSPRPPSPGPSSLIPLSPHAVSPCVSPQLVSTQPPQAPQPGTSKEKDAICSDELTEELGEDILKLLGDAPKAEVPLGPFIHKDIASRWQDILAKGLPKDIKEGLLKDYLVPGNCDLLLAPALNPEVKAALPDILVKRDSSLLYKQKQLGVALSALASVMEMVITNESSKQKILKPLSDACRILCDSHYVETKIRRKFVVSSINAKLKDALVETNRDKLLFGENVSDKLKTAKTIQQSGESLKNVQKPKFQRPNVASTNTNKGRLNYFPQHRKTDNKINDNRRPINPAQRQSQATSARRPTDRPLPVRAAATHRR